MDYYLSVKINNLRITKPGTYTITLKNEQLPLIDLKTLSISGIELLDVNENVLSKLKRNIKGIVEGTIDVSDHLTSSNTTFILKFKRSRFKKSKYIVLDFKEGYK